MSCNGKASTTGTLRQPQEPGVLSQTVNQARRRKVKAGWPFPGAHQAPPGQSPERSRPSPAPFSRSSRETEAKSRQRLTDTPHPPRSKGHPWLAQPPSPRSCWALPVVPTYGPGGERSRAGGQRNLRGETRNCHCCVTASPASAGGANLGEEQEHLHRPVPAQPWHAWHTLPSRRLQQPQNSPRTPLGVMLR